MQDAFWPMHDQLFATASAQGGSAVRSMTMETLIDAAAQLGLDRAAFQQCMIRQETLQTVKDSLAEAYGLELSSTPSLFLNGQKMANPFDYEGLTAEIDRLLGEAGN